MGAHLIDGMFQSDKYPQTPRGKVPLSCRDADAQDLLWEYAQRHRRHDPEFSEDLEQALGLSGYSPVERPSQELALAAVRTLLSYIGDDPGRDGLQDTPARVLKAWREEWGRGYREPPPIAGLTSFDNDGDYDQMVVKRGLVFHSHCEHHVAPFSGVATVAYLPKERRIIGISKLSRIVDHFAARLQVQERLTSQIAGFIEDNVSPDCAVMMEASHSCMTSRGVKQPKSTMITTALRGIFKSDPATQQEFLSQAKR